MCEHPTPGAKIDIAQVFRRFARAYRDAHPLADTPARVLRDVERCRTPMLGGHRYRCEHCRQQVVLYNSCLNRHCPTCQGPAQYRWIAQRQRRLVNAPYFHVVFTLPALLRDVVHTHRRPLFTRLFHSVAETLQAFAADPKRLGAQPAFTLVLHTWTRDMLLHPHLHAIVAAGGLSPDGARWVPVPDPDFLFPVVALGKVCRGKFLDGFSALVRAGTIDLPERDAQRLIRDAKRQSWVVFAKKPFGGPAQVLSYLGRYTHRVAISSARLVAISDDAIVFRTRGEKTCSLKPREFIRRFLLHVLPRQFFKIRHYGLLAPGNVTTRLRRAQEILGTPPPATGREPVEVDPDEDRPTDDPARTEERGTTDAGAAAPACPHCGGRLVALTPRRPQWPHAPPANAAAAGIPKR
jgi:hypothetical protein